MLKATHITKYYGTEKVLNKISFVLEEEHKVALVGLNGTGKTTLLKIIAGITDPDNGKIEIHKNTTLGFLPQDPDLYNKQIVLKYIEQYVGKSNDTFLRTVEIMFAGFALPSEIKSKRIGDLSSGQKTKVFLTALLLKDVDLMLLDEPTNNQDLPALIWLEDFLQKTESAFIVVSHDRKFLDKVANKIYEIDWKERTLNISNGQYSDYLVQTFKERKRQDLSHGLQREDIKRLRIEAENKKEKALKGAKYQAPDNDRMLRGYRRDKAGDSFKDSKMLYRRIKRMDIIEKPNERRDFTIEIKPEDSGSSRDIMVRDLICGYDDGFRIGPIDMEIPFGSRVCILGLNGSGKSTFLKTVIGSIPKISGTAIVDSGVKFGNLLQEHESLSKDETILGFISKRVDSDRDILQNHLKHFGFSSAQMKTKIKNLNPGGRARLLLSYFSANNVNVLVLDEPTNHLDLEAEEALEKTLNNFEGTILAVTHDRFFVEKIAAQSLYVLSEGKMNKIGDFKEYVTEMEKRSRKLLKMLGK